MPLPEFLIIGSMKSGTTTLAEYLRMHPEVYMPPYEIHFFEKNRNFKKGLKWYLSFFSKNNKGLSYIEKLQFKAREFCLYYFQNQNIKRHYSKSKKIIMGEKTPTYCYFENAAKRIQKTLPNVKLIWILRNPIKRAFSHYCYSVSKGNENLTFQQCVNIEINSSSEFLSEKKRFYIDMGLYSSQIEKFLKYFKKEQILFVIFEEFIENPKKELEKVYEFLNINKSYFPQNEIRLKKTKVPKYYKILLTIRKSYNKLLNFFGYRDIIYLLFAIIFGIFEQIISINNCYNNSIFTTLTKELEKCLKNYYRLHNNNLEKILGLNLNSWNSEIYS